jgi:methionine-rich copper-binding protein CopC
MGRAYHAIGKREHSALQFRYPKRKPNSNFFKQGANTMKKISVRSAAIALTFCLCTFIAAAQTKPNLTGTWKMNPSMSKFVNNGPSEITIKFDQRDSSFTETFTITENNGEHKVDLKYNADGKETTNQIENRTVQTTAKWEGETLVVEWKSEQDLFVRKITVSSDGKTMTMAVHRTKGEKAFDETVVLEKQ